MQPRPTEGMEVSDEFGPGIKTFAFGPLKLHFGADKLVFIDSQEEGGRHLTIHFGGFTGIIDAHVTEPAAGNHRPLGGIAKADIESLLSAAGPQVEEYFLKLMKKVLRPVRFGWLEHRGILTFPPTLYEPQGLLAFGEQQGKRWVLNRGRLEEFFRRNLRRADLQEPDAAYVLHSRRHGSPDYPYGMLLKFTDDRGRVRFFWFRFSELMRELEELWRIHSPHIRSLLVEPDQVVAAIGGERTDRHHP
jgi:hypothetical protein